ncbi:hypothetical protein QR680_014167 [Steinernema hermaphroditum]|uniref:Mevalonate kinase n=1 Tax=Steinernema hermaphroditum TaxID=289476 RepID=A0AA39IA76_9BILA|nr:hypothetical protein QR680_014167 [Steinernema hermaphroditum]
MNSSRNGPTASPMRSLTSGHGGLYISAPGKIILFGEHAVVGGKTAVAGSIDLRTYASLFTSKDGRIYLSLPDLGVEKTWMLKDLVNIIDQINAECPPEDDSPLNLENGYTWAQKMAGIVGEHKKVERAFLVFWYLLIGVFQRKSIDILSSSGDMHASTCKKHLEKTLLDLLAVKLTVKSELSSCVGLGSSGAYCVCIATALLQTAGIIPAPSIPVNDCGDLTWDDHHLEIIRNWSAAAESIIHISASGLDATMSTFGGLASYGKGQPIAQLHNVPELRVILVNSKIERSTGEMVKRVKRKQDEYPDIINGIFNTIDSISLKAVDVLKKASQDSVDSYNPLNELCRICNEQLSALGVGHAKLDQICTLLARYGIYPKITGAGGGGCVFGFLKKDTASTVISMIEEELSKHGYEIWQPVLGGPGVSWHFDRPNVFPPPSRAVTPTHTSRHATPA